MKASFLAAIAIVSLATTAFADSDGNELLHQCSAAVRQDDGIKTSPEEVMGSVYCLGYLAGFTDSHAFEVGITKPKKPLYCLPEGGNKGTQLARIVTKYLKNHPEDLHRSARLSVAMALSLAFPCSK